MTSQDSLNKENPLINHLLNTEEGGEREIETGDRDWGFRSGI